MEDRKWTRIGMIVWGLGLMPLLSMSISQAAKPTTQPARDSSMDSILGFSKSAPATQPAAMTEPAAVAAPLKNQDDADESLPGEITLSNGKKIKGKIATTPEKPIRIWVEAEKDYQDIPLSMIATAEAELVWERDEKEWNFKESGSDIKVYSGRTYPARETKYKLTLTDGTIIEGGIVAPLYVTTEDGKISTYVLYKRDKGEIGQTLADRPYVKKVALGNAKATDPAK
jgi:hypothetical protein